MCQAPSWPRRSAPGTQDAQSQDQAVAGLQSPPSRCAQMDRGVTLVPPEAPDSRRDRPLPSRSPQAQRRPRYTSRLQRWRSKETLQANQSWNGKGSWWEGARRGTASKEGSGNEAGPRLRDPLFTQCSSAQVATFPCATVGQGLGPKAALGFGNHSCTLGENRYALGAWGRHCADMQGPPVPTWGSSPPAPSSGSPSLTPSYPQCTEAGSCARVRRQGGRLAREGRFLSPAPTP